MAVPRKDVKVLFDAEVHAALKVIASHKDMGLAEYIESLVAPHVRSYVRNVTVLAAELQRSGIPGEGPEFQGKARDSGFGGEL